MQCPTRTVVRGDCGSHIDGADVGGGLAHDKEEEGRLLGRDPAGLGN